VKEETGLEVKPTELLGIYLDTYGDGRNTLNIHYIGKIVSGKMNAQEDVASLHWVPINNVPVNEGFKNTREALKDLQKWYSRNNELGLSNENRKV
jgi:ADP-ribose pyrophosphatase YjhB (NUDIX family)